MQSIDTDFSRLLGIRYPIICAPMFLVSNVEMVVAASEAGGIGTFPSLNYRPVSEFANALKQIRKKTKKPFGVNIIVNKSNTRQTEDLKLALDAGCPLFITSLGNPKEVIRQAHTIGSKVVCDVTNLEHAKKVEDMGADGVVAVGTGAGGHAGPIASNVLIPWLKEKLSIPIVAAGGIATGAGIASSLALGASAVHIGTRFIASEEARVDNSYKSAIVDSSPEDIVLTTRVSGTPASVIKTPYVEKMGLDLPWLVKRLKEFKPTKRYVVPLIHLLGSMTLEKSATKPNWKAVWSAGQCVGLIHEVASVQEIMNKLVKEYFAAVAALPRAQEENNAAKDRSL